MATLPLLANFLDEPFNPSPYAPVSRLFWNELYLDVPRIPEFADCPAAQTLVDSMEFCRDLETARRQSLIDYRKVMALKRRILEALLQSFLNGNSSRRPSFDKFIATHPRTEDYAVFRAKVERERQVWPHWQSPEPRWCVDPGGLRRASTALSSLRSMAMRGTNPRDRRQGQGARHAALPRLPIGRESRRLRCLARAATLRPNGRRRRPAGRFIRQRAKLGVSPAPT